MFRVWTRRWWVAVAAALAALLTGCSSTDTSAPSSQADQGAGQGPFPVSITDRFGTTTISQEPKRVVSLNDDDIVIALGVTPVGILRDPNHDGGIAPWLAGKVDTAKTTLIDYDGETFNIEQVAALQPDLIVATGHYGLEQVRDRLAAIAPVVGFNPEWGAQTWQERTRVVATALGRTEQAERVIADTEAVIARVRAAHPGIERRTVSFSNFYAPGQIVTLKSDRDHAVRILEELGLRIPDQLRALPDIAPGNPNGALSYENISLLDADLVLALFGEGMQQTIEALEPFRALPAVQQGRYFTVDMSTAIALRNPSPLSIPYALDRLEPALQAAAAAPAGR